MHSFGRSTGRIGLFWASHADRASKLSQSVGVPDIGRQAL